MDGMSTGDHNDLVSAWESEQSRVIRNFVRGESRCLFSSAGLGWPGIMLEEHEISPKSRPAAELSRLVLCFWNNNETMRCDHPDANGYFVPKLFIRELSPSTPGEHSPRYGHSNLGLDFS